MSILDDSPSIKAIRRSKGAQASPSIRVLLAEIDRLREEVRQSARDADRIAQHLAAAVVVCDGVIRIPEELLGRAYTISVEPDAGRTLAISAEIQEPAQ